MDLSRDEIFVLIDAYKNQKVLWNSNHKGYFNKGSKTKAWQGVADAVGVDVESARRKMASLLGSFRREKSRGKKGDKDDPTNMQYKSDWFAFKAFGFLLDPALNNSTNLDSGQSEAENSNSQFDYKSEFDDNSLLVPKDADYDDYVIPDAPGSDFAQETTATAFPKPARQSISRKRSRSSHQDTTYTEHRAKREYCAREHHKPNESVRRDATAKFVKYLEAKLNLFHPTASAILIHKINQLIFEAEMSSISQPHSYSMASASPKSNWSPSPPHINPLVEIEVTKCNEKDDEEDKKEGIITIV